MEMISRSRGGLRLARLAVVVSILPVVEFANVTIEVCDGIPQHVEDEIVTSDRFCPWSARVVAVEGPDA